MIDRGGVRRLLGIAALLVFLAAAAVWAATSSLSLPGGLVLGFALGAIPFASWAWVAGRARTRVVAALLLAVKLPLYAGVLYLFVTRRLVHPAGVLIGITAVVTVLSVGSFVGASARPKEAA
jgi:hypothetical protein